ncbi:YqiA/YcfP family alpha/beta fold hydrolase [Pseudomonas sp. GCM10022188]|uniref:YqiA/YcfP family alpha/beta fold hydrolase n=1 Tax=Pseudomonas TaxID=286 RepID=UPI001E36B5B5|nr:YqiA/YcfP family alpha/beta fold hydrolase [Pseudomonas oryzagri]MCC6076430.1 esterase [Pseudomonas oryzagri]
MPPLPTLIYMHGFNSSPASLKARELVAACECRGLAERLRVPTLHHDPRQAIAQLEREIAEADCPVLVGSSLGGYYATYLAERHGLKALLINPAVRVERYFAGYLGPQRNYYSGESWELTAAHVAALAALEVPPPRDPQRFLVWLQTGDETLDYRDAADYYRHCTLDIQPDGDHGYQGFAARIPELLAFAGFSALPQS